MHRLFCVVMGIGILTGGVGEASDGRLDRLSLCPRPQIIRACGAGDFQVTDWTRISGPEELVATVRSVLSDRLSFRKLRTGDHGIAVRRPIRPDDPIWQNDQAYQLTVSPTGIVVEAEEKVGCFYAAQTLVQLIRNSPKIPSLSIRDWPEIPTRLAMIATDQGGFQVIDVTYWKRIIRELSAFKFNALMPYFDDGTYRYKKYPFLGHKGTELTQPCSTGVWYHCRIALKRDSLSFLATDRETGRTMAYSGGLSLDPVGETLSLTLCDEQGGAGAGQPHSAWRNLTVNELKPMPVQKLQPPVALLSQVDQLVDSHLEIEQLVDSHLEIEQTFRDSVREAGGGSADIRQLSIGGTVFGSSQGRADLEALSRHLRAGRLPIALFETGRWAGEKK